MHAFRTKEQWDNFSKKQTRIPCDLPFRLFRWLKDGRDESEYEPPEPELSTCHPIGSLAKVDVMRQRYLRGEHLYHPGDSVAVADEDARTRLARLKELQGK